MNREQSGSHTFSQERIKFHDFSCAHGRLEDLEKTLEMDTQYQRIANKK